LKEKRLVTARTLAQLFENHEFRGQVAEALKPHLRNLAGNWAAARVGFPAVLGLEQALDVNQDLQNRLGLPVFEIPTLPPSIPGIRLHNLLVKVVRKNGGRIYEGMQVTGAEAENGQVLRVWSQAAARPLAHAARNFVLATGGILGGGLITTWDDFTKELIFNLPVSAPQHHSAWLAMEFLASAGHPVFQAGAPVNPSFQPVDETGQTPYENLWVVGAALAGCDPVLEGSVEGIALATGFLVGERLIPGKSK
jgi:glycerol-3-phosphate dehydrogenase subunit B